MRVNSGCVCFWHLSVLWIHKTLALLTNIWECDNCRECESILESGWLRTGREAQRMFHKFCLFFFLRILQEGGWEAPNKILSSNNQAPCMCWNVLGTPSEGDGEGSDEGRTVFSRLPQWLNVPAWLTSDGASDRKHSCVHWARSSVYVRLEMFWGTGLAGCEVMGDLKLRGRWAEVWAHLCTVEVRRGANGV